MIYSGRKWIAHADDSWHCTMSAGGAGPAPAVGRPAAAAGLMGSWWLMSLERLRRLWPWRLALRWRRRPAPPPGRKAWGAAAPPYQGEANGVEGNAAAVVCTPLRRRQQPTTMLMWAARPGLMSPRLGAQKAPAARRPPAHLTTHKIGTNGGQVRPHNSNRNVCGVERSGNTPGTSENRQTIQQITHYSFLRSWWWLFLFLFCLDICLFYLLFILF